jgi:hypothetical protein
MDTRYIVDTLLINKIIWLRSLPESELGPSRRITEDLETVAANGKLAFDEVVVEDRNGLLQALGDITKQAGVDLRPILHFDCHGSMEHGLLLAPSGEHLSWDDLADALRPINAATGGNLCCVFAACFGLRLGWSLKLSKPAPFYLMIAPKNEIAVGALEEKTVPFYRDVLKTENITQSHAGLLAPELQLLNCMKLFDLSLVQYWLDHCSHRAIQKRVEELTTLYLHEHGMTNPSHAQLSELRRSLKTKLQPSQSLIDQYAGSFLLGRDPRLSVDELRRLVERCRRGLRSRKAKEQRA